MDTAEIRKLPKQNCLLVVSGRNPFYSEKYDYMSHPNYKYTSDANNAYSYEYTPPEAPKSKKQIAEEVTFEDNEKKQRIVARVNEDMERIDKELDEIQMNLNAQNLLNRMGQDFMHFSPIRDELLHTDDGSGEKVDEEKFFAALNVSTEIEH
jgi:hypothetical protein